MNIIFKTRLRGGGLSPKAGVLKIKSFKPSV
jgi:hypothetical protein